MTLFVDTSVWYAAADVDDRSHARAKEILTTGESLALTDHVMVETWFLIGARLGRAAAGRLWEGLRAGVATIEPVGAADLEAAWGIAQAYSDQRFSIVDCTSFAVMERLGLERAASFDAHFAIYRFGPQRRRAFTIVR